MRAIPTTIKTLLKSKSMVGENAPRGIVRFVQKVGGTTNEIPVERIRISREDAAMAQRADFKLINVNPTNPRDPGYYTPYRGHTSDFGQERNEWYLQILPEKRFEIDLGYGNDLVRCFYGAIDDVTINAYPDDYSIQIDARDRGWNLIDRIMTGPDTAEPYYVEYADLDVSVIVRTALVASGFDISEIKIDMSGIVTDIEFDKKTYADLVEWAITMTGYDFRIDEYGMAFFQRATDRQPQALDEQHFMTGMDWFELENGPIVAESEIVWDYTRTVKYSRETDYEIDYINKRIRRRLESTMPVNFDMSVDYVYAAWTFRNGEDLFYLPYKLSRRNQYGKIVVDGASDTATYSIPNPTWDGRETSADKVLFVEDENLDSIEKCQEVANRLGTDMVRRFGIIEFATVAVPWLQIGDCIQIVEYSSTVSEIYQILSMDLELDKTGFIMYGTAAYRGYTPLQEV
jgi:hypothetical protein